MSVDIILEIYIGIAIAINTIILIALIGHHYRDNEIQHYDRIDKTSQIQECRREIIEGNEKIISMIQSNKNEVEK